MAQTKSKMDRKQRMIRVIALVLAGIMVLSAVLAALLSQVW